MTDAEDMIELLKGVALDILHEVVVVDAEISPDEYVSSMIDGPVEAAEQAVERDDMGAAQVVLEVALKDLIADFESGVLAVGEENREKPGYSLDVLRSRLTTTGGLTA